MKHTIKVTIILLLLFICSHLIGLFIVNHYLPSTTDLPLRIEKPQFAEETSYIPIFITIIFATLLALVLIRLKAVKVWKFWFLLSVFMTLTVAFNAFIPEVFAITLAVIFALLKIFKPNVYIHNLTELFIYGGLAAIFVPVLNVFSAIVLLILISIYDFIAVWHTKHMVSMAKFQSSTNIFAGLLVPYSENKIISKSYKKVPLSNKESKVKISEAMLGGGDIGFPLLFSGVILKTYGLHQALIVSFCSALALLVLFIIAEKKKFYPAMPFITAGCLIGYAIVYFI